MRGFGFGLGLGLRLGLGLGFRLRCISATEARVAAGRRDDSRKAASRYGCPACNRRWRRLQPWVAEAATVGG